MKAITVLKTALGGERFVSELARKHRMRKICVRTYEKADPKEVLIASLFEPPVLASTTKLGET
jgi:hypothetical protein